MRNWKNILFNIAIALNSLLVFLLIFEDRMIIPAWLQVMGRMHPLVLHFPLVIIILYAVAVIVKPPLSVKAEPSYNNATDLLLLLAVFSSVITSLAGLFLSKEEGYDPDTIFWHKWGGVVISILTLLWYGWRNNIHSRKALSVTFSAVAFFIIIITGHLGAGITHGEGFLLAPILPEKKAPVVDPEEALVYAHLVHPILESKCISCHNSKKAKGELIMETEELLLKGGKSGVLWDTTEADLGLMLYRVHLPLDEKKHMPPKGKPQLTDEEIELITQWIQHGADFDLRVAALNDQDTLKQLALAKLKTNEISSYDFDEADPSVVKKLNTANRVVASEALRSPALVVNFFNNRLFDITQVKELEKAGKQIVSLDLSRMPVKDEDLSLISRFENLRQLNLSFTEITGSRIGQLAKLKHLRNLTLSGTKVTAEHLKQLKDFPSLKIVHTWNTSVAYDDIEKLKQELSGIRFETGFRGDTITMKLSPPVILNEETFIHSSIPLRLKHYIQGATIRYTLDGTEPDSLHSPEFKGGETIEKNAVVKAKAFKPGWISSDVVEANFFRVKHIPDTVIYLTKANPKYSDDKGRLLINLEKGETDFRSGGWLGYREKMECLLVFREPVEVQNISLSTLVDVGSYIMPLQTMEVWGGSDPSKLKRLGIVKPAQPNTNQFYASRKGFECSFNPTTVKCIKLVVQPVSKLPSWHPGSGDKGWIFVDEVLVN